MEDFSILQARKRELETALDAISITKHGSTAWQPGVYDQHQSNSY